LDSVSSKARCLVFDATCGIIGIQRASSGGSLVECAAARAGKRNPSAHDALHPVSQAGGSPSGFLVQAAGHVRNE
jgi:hypothetical protein